jgi:endonuclease III
MLKSAKERSSRILAELLKRYPQVTTSLSYRDPFQLLVAVILSAQCTDKRVNMVTEKLFKRYSTAEDFACIGQKELEKEIRSTGFFRNKSKNIISSARRIMKDFKGRVPESMDELLSLDGVARKTANIVLYHGFGRNEGIAVDTHVFRVTHRLGLSSGKNPVLTEKELMELYPKSSYGTVSDAFILFGRDICDAKKPHCEVCPFQRICPYYLSVRK